MRRYRVNRPSVIYEILADELVIVNLKSGTYFSLDPVGALVWQEIDRGAADTEMVGTLAGRFEGDCEGIAAAVNDLLEQLRREDLILQDESNKPAAEPGPSPDAAGRVSFSVPILQKYTDMQDLLLLDPIHEVDESGWPVRKA